MKIINLKPGLITDVMDYLGIEIIRKNSLRCPFHNDKNPSGIISLEANTFKCFACGITLTSKQFFKKYLQENLGYSEEAAEEKWQEFLSLILDSEYTTKTNKSKINNKNKSKKENYINIADKLWNLIANCSTKSPYDIEVIEYLKKRKLPRQLLSDKIISILPLLDEKDLPQTDPELKNYHKFLIAAHKKGYKIAIPQKDKNGQIINIQLRNVDRTIKPKTISLKNHKVGNFIFEPKGNTTEINKIIITEGSIDFLQAITVSNFKHYVYGMYSATAKADPLIDFIKNKNINKIILIPHKDPEGIKMKSEIIKKIKETHEKKEIKIEKIITIDIKNYKDLAELIESKEEERKNISKAIHQA